MSEEDFSQPIGKTEDKFEKQVRLFRKEVKELINQVIFIQLTK